MSNKIQFNIEFGKSQPAAAKRTDDGMRRILVLGDFSGQSAVDLKDRHPVAVEVDTFDNVLSRIAPKVELPLPGINRKKATIDFRSLEDFHPDRLFDTAPFEALRELRRRLLDPTLFRQAADELGLVAGSGARQEEDASTPLRNAENDIVALGLLPTSSERERGDAGNEFREWINRLVAPYLVQAADPRQSEYVALIDEVIAEQMRRLLHDRSFQAIESAWRGLAWLIRSIADSSLQVHLLDVSKSALAADLEAADRDLQESAIYRLLVEEGVSDFGARPWSLLVGNYMFGLGPVDLKLLAALGAIAAQAGGPLLAGASLEVIGCQSVADLPDPAAWVHDAENRHRWQTLRSTPVAASLALAMPRVLLRTPYGKQTDPIESFAFEEIVGRDDHEAFLWGNPAVACAVLAGQYLGGGGALPVEQYIELEDLPTYIYREDGESHMLPCAEGFLTERGIKVLLSLGVIPLVSHKTRNVVTVPCFQSLAPHAE